MNIFGAIVYDNGCTNPFHGKRIIKDFKAENTGYTVVMFGRQDEGEQPIPQEIKELILLKRQFGVG